MASPPPGPPAWSVSVLLRHRCGLEIRAAAENVLPRWWGRGGERLSLLLRLRRSLRLSVTSQCGDGPTRPEAPPRGCGIIRFLWRRCARLPRIASIWRRKNQEQAPARIVAAAAAPRGRLAQVIRSPLFFNRSHHWFIQFMLGPRLQRSPTPAQPGFLAMARTPKSAATLRFVVAALAVAVASVAVFRLAARIECWDRRGGRAAEPVAVWTKLLEWMEHPPLRTKYKWLLGLQKRGLERIFGK